MMARVLNAGLSETWKKACREDRLEATWHGISLQESRVSSDRR